MNPFRLAAALLMMPRLAVRLLLVPIFIALAALSLQLWLVSLRPRELSTPKDVVGVNVARQLAYGSSAIRPTILTCKWVSKGRGLEYPPGRACLVSEHDVAIVGELASNLDLATLTERLNGNFDRLHICASTCKAGITIRQINGAPMITISGFSNLMLLKDSFSPTSTMTRDGFSLPGQKSLILAGLNAPISLSGLERQIAHLLTLVMLVVCCVWLSLKAHRRVLEYFATSGSLLPLAASAGPRQVYSALWIISAVRLFGFLLLAAPLFFGFASTSAPNGSTATSIGAELLWFIAVTASLVVTTLCASVADLQRRTLFSFLWRLLPLALVAIGFLGWAISLLVASPSTILVRHIIVATPLIGLAPLVASSIVQPPELLIVAHALLATGLAVVLARRNARWFASHFEDV